MLLSYYSLLSVSLLLGAVFVTAAVVVGSAYRKCVDGMEGKYKIVENGGGMEG
jgi:hypothetical protein